MPPSGAMVCCLPSKVERPAVAQVFKICLDYWNFFVPDVYASVTTGLADGSASFAFAGAVPPPGPAAAGRKALYREVLSRLRLLMITRMAKPEEVRPLPGSLACCYQPQYAARQISASQAGGGVRLLGSCSMWWCDQRECAAGLS